MTETTAPDRSVPPSPRPSHFWLRPKTLGELTLGLLVLLAVSLGCFTIGRDLADQQIRDDEKMILGLSSQLTQAQTKSNDLTAENGKQANQIKDLNSKLADIFSPSRKLTIYGNKSTNVSIGQFTVGLIGAPESNGVNLNINGKPQTMAAGNATNLTFSTNCRIEVASFDILTSSAVVNTTCSAANP